MKFNQPEGATPLENDEIVDLIPEHVKMQEELNAWELKNILEGYQWAKKKKNLVSFEFIKQLHYHMFDKTWKWAGKFRTTDKNLGIYWAHIPTKIKELCDDVLYQLEHHVFSMDEIAIRFHHKLVWIHPFPNGNGRHARLIADLLIKKNGGKVFSWGQHQDLQKPTEVRKQYIEALRKADKGDYSSLLLFART